MEHRERNIILIGLWLVIFYTFAMWITPFQTSVLKWPSLSNQIDVKDADAWLRLTQVKQWIEHPDFFNHTVEHVNTPLGDIKTPWTRPMDVVLLLPYLVMPTHMPIEQRLMLSATWTPVLLGFLTILFLIKTSAGHFKNIEKTAIVLLCFIFNPFVSLHFLPGDADHHGLQTLLFCAALYLLTRSQTRVRAIMLGIVTGLSIWVSVEAFIIFPFIYGFASIQTIHRRGSFAHLTWASSTAAAVSIFGLLIETPINEIFTQLKYDTLSAPYVMALLLGACGMGMLHYLMPKIKYPCRFYQSGYSLMAGIAILLGTILFYLFPDIVKGPFVGLDIKYLTTVFFPSAAEALPLLKNDTSLICIILALPVITVFLSFFFLKKSPILWGLFYLSLAMVLNQTRWFYYLEPVSIVLIAKYLPILLRRYSKNLSPKIKFQYFSVPLIILFLALPNIFTPLNNNAENDKTSSYQVRLNTCAEDVFFNIQSQNLTKKIGNMPVNIETNITRQATPLLFFTPYKIITAHYHREIESEKQWNILFSTSNADTAFTILKEHQINYLIVCPDDQSWLKNYADSADEHPSLNWVENLGNLLPAPKNKSLEHQKPVLLKIHSHLK